MLTCYDIYCILLQIQADYEHSEDKIRRIIAEAAAVLKVL